MRPDSRTYEQILAGHPECFAVPHAGAFNPMRCESCRGRRECYSIAAQLLLAKKVGLLNGKIIMAAPYSAGDEHRIVEYVMANAELTSAVLPCNLSALPKLYDRAALAYANRAPEPSVDEMLTDLTSLLEVPEARKTVIVPGINAETARVTSPSSNRGTSPEISLSAETGPILRDNDARGRLATADFMLATIGGGLPSDEVPPPSPLRYSFPVPESRRYAHCTNGALVDEIKLLIERGRLATTTKHYNCVRKEICAIHIEMNLRQQHAPRFRPQCALPKKAEGSDDETLARDRQVIDLHWRANATDKPMSPVADFPSIFDNERFDFDLAARFAQLTWRQQTKVIHLRLTEDMQWEHAIIQAPSLRDRWRTIERGDVRGSKVKQVGAPHIYTLLHESMANEPHLRPHIPGLVRIWMARRIVGDAPKRVARLVGLMTGERAKDASATRRAMASLDARFATAQKGRSKV